MSIPFGTNNKYGFFLVSLVSSITPPVLLRSSYHDGEFMVGFRMLWLWAFLYVRLDRIMLKRHMYVVADSFLSDDTAYNYLPFARPLNVLQAAWLRAVVFVESRGKAHVMRGKDFFEAYPFLFEC